MKSRASARPKTASTLSVASSLAREGWRDPAWFWWEEAGVGRQVKFCPVVSAFDRHPDEASVLLHDVNGESGSAKSPGDGGRQSIDIVGS